VRVQVGDAKLVAPLLDYFERQADCVAVQVGESEIEVALLGSYGNAAHDAAVDDIVAVFNSRIADARRLQDELADD
jgi:hypothetical protein